ncbi:GEM-like protein 2 isoform X2 [Argentina anserina]|uniref:GEM-like protein 2 isoform X2 n=1 Tax=Argentina anserina TaxID=57926 RepID=UPI0021764F06|nr:GEM-like protein 2 isoform X2 [Potentilla anserina]
MQARKDKSNMNTKMNGPIDKVLDTLNQCGKRVEGASKRVDTITDNVWNHLRMSPNLADAAMARLTHGTKALTRGDEKVFQQTFETIMLHEKLLHSYACYLSTSTGPVIGMLYISNKRIAFCSDFCHYISPAQPNTYYKVVLQLDQLRAVNPSANRWNPSEKYIQIVTRDGHEYWFMGFISYVKALSNLTHAINPSSGGTP